MAAVPACNGQPKFKNEDALVEKLRQHLREAARNPAIKGMTCHYNFVSPTPGSPSSVRSEQIKLTIEYTYLENHSVV